MDPDGPLPQYACRCLNIRISPQNAPGPTPPPPADHSFLPVFAGEDGLSASHTELTLRSQTRPVEDRSGETSQMTRYVSVTCLICQTPAYRVQQIVTPDVDLEEGPVLPTDDWVEHELLKSITGWVEVNKDCLSGDAISDCQRSQQYSSQFGIVIPEGETSDFTTPSHTPPSPSSPVVSEAQPHAPRQYLPPLPPLFAPPPFTPSHQTFTHLASVATAKSEATRTEANLYIAAIARQKAEEVRASEADLRRQVGLLWQRYREALETVHQGPGAVRPGPQSRKRMSSGKWSGLTSPTTAAHDGSAASVRVADFVPVPSPPPRASSTTSRQVASALSASLKTTSFHHPRAQAPSSSSTSRPAEPAQSPPPYESPPISPSHSSAIRIASPSIASSRTLAMPIDGEAEIRLAHRRDMNESKDIATSFRYVMDLEKEMEEQQRQRVSASAADSDAQSTMPNSSKMSHIRSPKASKSTLKKSNSENATATAPAEQHPSSPKEEVAKGKRKVTFDVKPEVAIINTGDSTSAEPVSKESEDIFEMDSETEERPAEEGESAIPAATVPPLVHANSEPVRAPRRPTRARNVDTAGLPSSFAALRPASLPNLSAMRRPPPQVDSIERPRSQVLRETVVGAEAENTRNKTNGYTPQLAVDPKEIDEALGPREAEILRLVAANTPSHRNAWKEGSRAWQLFVHRHDDKAKLGAAKGTIPEEDEYVLDEPTDDQSDWLDDNDTDMGDDVHRIRSWPARRDGTIAGSLPIPIGHLSHGRQVLGLSSYQPRTSVTDRPGSLPGSLMPALQKASAAAMRKASYAARDRERSFDPGALDFVSDQSDDDEDEDDMPPDAEVGSLARQRALRILQKRSEVPEAGMWRSLA